MKISLNITVLIVAAVLTESTMSLAWFEEVIFALDACFASVSYIFSCILLIRNHMIFLV